MSNKEEVNKNLAEINRKLDQIESFVRKALTDFNFPANSYLRDLNSKDGVFTGEASPDGETWYGFSIGPRTSKVFEIEQKGNS